VPNVTAVQHPHAYKMFCLCTECCVKRAYQLCVDVLAIRRLVFIEDDRLDIDVSSASRGMDTVDGHEVLRGLSDGIGPFLLWYRVSFSTAAIMTFSLVGVRTVRGRPVCMCAAQVTNPISRNGCSSPRKTFMSA
jgi:hypothetical protein